MRAKKAQMSSIDLLMSLVLFLVMIVAVSAIWGKYESRLRDSSSYNEMELVATQISDLLIKSPGVPDNWEEIPNSTIFALGLALDDRVISPEKLSAFSLKNYNETKRLLNIDRYEFYFLLKKGNQSIAEAGSLSSKRAAKITRSVLYENKESTMELIIWG